MYKEQKGEDYLSHKELLLISFPVSIVNTLLIMPADCIKTFYQEFTSSKKGWSLWKITK